MNRFSFFNHIALSVALSLMTITLHNTVTPFIGYDYGYRILILSLSVGYLSFLLHQLKPRFGVALILVFWCVMSLLLFTFNPSLPIWLMAHIGCLWMVRATLRYQHIQHWLLDSLVNLLAICAGIATYLHTQNIGLSVWSYFLVLALVALLAPSREQEIQTFNASPFQVAQNAANAALRRLQKPSY